VSATADPHAALDAVCEGLRAEHDAEWVSASGRILQGGLVYIDKRGQVASMGQRPVDRCRGCGSEIDPDCCGCGSPLSDHSPVGDGHSFRPMGCDCGRDSAPPAVDVAAVTPPATRCPSCDSTAIARRTPDAPWHCPVCSWCRHELSAPPAPPRFAVGAWLRDVTRPADCGQVMSASSDGDEPMYLVCRENESSNFWVRERDAVEVQR